MIYMVEDDENIRELVSYTLNNLGFATTGFEEGESFLKALEKNLPELIILDIMLPGMDGLTLLQKIRKQERTKDLPVILLTAKTSEFDKVKGLDSGADDYLTKPFGVMELVARIKALLRRVKVDPMILKAGALTVDVFSHRVFVQETEISLTSKEFELLVLFLNHKKQAFTRDQLLNRLWGYDYDGESRTVDVHIASLRQKLGPVGGNIETIRGHGYRFDEVSHV